MAMAVDRIMAIVIAKAHRNHSNSMNNMTIIDQSRRVMVDALVALPWRGGDGWRIRLHWHRLRLRVGLGRKVEGRNTHRCNSHNNNSKHAPLDHIHEDHHPTTMIKKSDDQLVHEHPDPLAQNLNSHNNNSSSSKTNNGVPTPSIVPHENSDVWEHRPI